MARSSSKVEAPVPVVNPVTGSPEVVRVVGLILASDTAADLLASEVVRLKGADDLAYRAAAQGLAKLLPATSKRAAKGAPTAKSVSEAAIAAGASGAWSETMLGNVKRAGELLNLPGELPSGYTARKVQALFEVQRTVEGREGKQNVMVGAKQLPAIIKAAADLADAIKRCEAQIAANVKALEIKPEPVPAAGTGSEGSEGSKGNESAADMLRRALDLVSRAYGMEWTGGEAEIATSIRAAMDAGIDDEADLAA